MVDITIDPFNGATVDFRQDDENHTWVVEIHSGRRIPARDGNRHWEAVKRWVAQGNTIKPAITFTQRKNRRVGMIDELRRRKLSNLTVTVGGKGFPATTERAAFMAATLAAVNAGLGLPPGFSVRTTTGEKININETQLRTYCKEIALAQNALEQDLWARIDAINAAADDIELDAVDTTT